MYYAYAFKRNPCLGDGCKTREPENANNYFMCKACARNVHTATVKTTLVGLDILRYTNAKRMKVAPPLPPSKDLIKQQKEFKALGGSIKAHTAAPIVSCPSGCCHQPAIP